MIKTERIFSDGMILQREQPILVWGMCEGTAQITVTLGQHTAAAEIKEQTFYAVLPPFPAAKELTMTICGHGETGEEEKLVYRDVAVGEVWIAGGQSNMEFPVRYDKDGEELLNTPADSLFRYFDVPKICYEGQEQEITFRDRAYWRPFCRENAPDFSAAASWFALKLRRELHVPVGIVGCNWGATSASCWLEEKYLAEDPALLQYIDVYKEGLKKLDLEEYKKAYFERIRFGTTPRMKEIDEAINRGTLGPDELGTMMKQLTPEKLKLLSLPAGPLSHTRPCVLFDTMVKRIAGYGAKGVLWYQGEADEVLPGEYARLFSRMVQCWRAHWKSRLPFLCVQLAPFERWLGSTGKEFPKLRRQQERAAALIDDVWLTSIMDGGMEWDIHPKEKRLPGERLALLALGKLYGKDILCEPPALADAEWKKDRIVLYLKHTGDGLFCKSQKPEGLAVWADGDSRPFTARIEGERIILDCGNIEDAVHVQVSYAQKPYVKADLYGSSGLCAMPFEAVRPFDWKEK